MQRLTDIISEFTDEGVSVIGIDTDNDYERMRERALVFQLGIDEEDEASLSLEIDELTWMGTTWDIETTVDDPETVIDETACVLYTEDHGSFPQSAEIAYQTMRMDEIRELDISEPEEDTTWRACAQELREVTRGAIDIRTAEVLVLYQTDVPSDTISDVLDISVDDVHDRISLARRSLPEQVLSDRSF
ncbi:hypothetical protein [Halosimplex pelagicum]|uniref:Uncharacterized protein n=1 Tax=Halosimplex pelagicum TaxID=869886 RepID=A0A7D5T9L5_9EURY|nr:hypothetical protein [Halosimplex pelagicum]QLH82030.1 hypothetical protein HZS54_10530 [Halosimplex pelagicum]